MVKLNSKLSFGYTIISRQSALPQNYFDGPFADIDSIGNITKYNVYEGDKPGGKYIGTKLITQKPNEPEEIEYINIDSKNKNNIKTFNEQLQMDISNGNYIVTEGFKI
jgi:hypothetical protein